MGDHLSTNPWLLVLGAVTGVLSSLATSFFTSFLVRRAESRKSRADIRRDYLDPLRVASRDLRDGFDRVYTRVILEKDLEQDALKEDYNLRFWFRRCKAYIVDPNVQWTEEMRRRDIAMHSGGMGAQATSTLYSTASYLYYATRIRFKSPYIQLGSSDRELIARVDDVRTRFSQLEFYSVTQDSIGVSMKNAGGELKDYREFCEAITSRSEGAWFMTLTDVFFKLHTHGAEDATAFLASLDRLGTFLDQSLPAKPL
jgi:hypothetical protein